MTGKLIGLPDRKLPVAEHIYLVGRDRELAALEQSLANHEEAAIVASAQLHGGGGLGKTALALEYCHRNLYAYQSIWWVDCETHTSVSASYEKYLVFNELPRPANGKIRDLVDHHAAEQEGLLVIYDNVTYEVYRELAKPTGAHVVATTRNPDNWPNPIEVGTIDREPAIEWILYVSQRAGAHAFGQSTDGSTSEQIAEADRLYDSLDGHALALAIATAYINQTGTSPGRYAELLDSHPDQHHADPGILTQDYHNTVYGAIAISLQQLEIEGRHSPRLLLDLCSFYAPNDIPLSIFTQESLKSERPNAVSESANYLRCLSLAVFSDAEKTKISIHRLTQAATRYYLHFGLPNVEIERALAANTTRAMVMIQGHSGTGECGRLDTEAEIQSITEIVGTSRIGDLLNIKPVLAATSQRVSEAVMTENPNILHFSGHGHNGYLLVRASPETQKVDFIDAEHLATILKEQATSLIFLNACYSDNIAADLIGPTTVVVGTISAVPDDEARDFAKRFYTAISQNNTYGAAFDIALAAATLEDKEESFHLFDQDDVAHRICLFPAT